MKLWKVVTKSGPLERKFLVHARRVTDLLEQMGPPEEIITDIMLVQTWRKALIKEGGLIPWPLVQYKEED